LNAPEPPTGNENGIDGDPPVDSPEDHAQAQVPRPSMPQGGMPPQYGGITPEQAMQYQTYLQQQQQGAPGYPLPPGARMPPHNPHNPHNQ